MYANRRNFRVLREIGVAKHHGDVRFFTGSGNTAISRIRNASSHNYWNSSFIMDVAKLAMGQILRSTERISSFIIHTCIDSAMLCRWSFNTVENHQQVTKQGRR